MKTKKYMAAWLLAGISFLITSCQEMDVFPQDQLGPDNFWLTENDINMGIAGVYSTMKNGYMDWRVYWLEGISDNGYCQHPSQSPLFNMKIGTLEATSGGPVSDIFSGSYKASIRLRRSHGRTFVSNATGSWHSKGCATST